MTLRPGNGPCEPADAVVGLQSDSLVEAGPEEEWLHLGPLYPDFLTWLSLSCPVLQDVLGTDTWIIRVGVDMGLVAVPHREARSPGRRHLLAKPCSFSVGPSCVQAGSQINSLGGSSQRLYDPMSHTNRSRGLLDRAPYLGWSAEPACVYPYYLPPFTGLDCLGAPTLPLLGSC